MAPMSPEEILRARVAVKSELVARQKREQLRGSFAAFVRWAWQVLEPGRELRWNWSMQLICDLLQAFAFRRFHRVIANVPPRSSKSTLFSVCYPVWVWIQDPDELKARGVKGAEFVGPYHQFLTLANSSDLALRDAMQSRNLIESEPFRELFGDHVHIADGQNEKKFYRNTANGHRNGQPIGGRLTGKGGDTIMCFPHWQEVLTEDGYRTIGDVVESRYAGEVLSFDGASYVWRPISAWRKNPGRPIYRVTFSDGATVDCTADHRLMTRRGWVEAQDLQPSDRIPQVPVRDFLADVQHEFFADPVPLGRRVEALRAVVNRANVFVAQLIAAARSVIGSPNIDRVFSPGAPCADLHDGGLAHTVALGEGSHRFVAEAYLPGGFRGEFGSLDDAEWERAVGLRVFDVSRPGAVGEVLKSVVSRVAVKVANIVAVRPRPDERERNRGVDVQRLADPAVPGIDAKVTLPVVAEFQCPTLESKGLPILAGDRAWFGSQAPEVRDAVVGETGDRSPLFIELIGHVEHTYCLTVSDHHNFVAGDTIVSNCDDPHSADDALSDAERQNVLDAYFGKVTSRLNDQKDGGIAIIMQRIHGGDLVAEVVKKDGVWSPENPRGWVWLVLPMRYELDDPEKGPEGIVNPAGALGFKDPRTEPGELLWPDRFPEHAVKQLESDLTETSGIYGASCQLQQRPAPSEGGIIRKKDWRRWPDDTALPICDHVFLSWDTAYSEQDMKTNSYSARTAWGVFWHEQEQQHCLILLHAWADRMSYPDLRVKAQDDTFEFQPDAHLIEKKASGISLLQDLRRAGRGKKRVRLRTYTPDRDKIARAHAASGTFWAGLVYAPNRKWADKVIDACAIFPNGAPPSADYTDTVTQAVLYLRRGWWVNHPDDEDITAEVGSAANYDEDEHEERQRGWYG